MSFNYYSLAKYKKGDEIKRKKKEKNTKKKQKKFSKKQRKNMITATIVLTIIFLIFSIFSSIIIFYKEIKSRQSPSPSIHSRDSSLDSANLNVKNMIRYIDDVNEIKYKDQNFMRRSINRADYHLRNLSREAEIIREEYEDGMAEHT